MPKKVLKLPPPWDVADVKPSAPTFIPDIAGHRKAVKKAETKLKEAMAALALAEKEAKGGK